MAQKRRTRKRSGTTSRRRRSKNIVVVGRRRSSRRSVGAIGSTTHRRRRRSVGSTGGTLKSIMLTSAGMVAGAMATSMLLRPLENKVAQQFPFAAKMMGAAEVFLGGWIAVKGKTPLIKGVGLGVMSAGINTVMHQFNVGQHSPAIAGADDYSTIRIPISGSYTNLIAGMMDNEDMMSTNTSLVAGSDQEDMYRTYLLAGVGEESEDWLDAKGYSY